MIKNYFQVSSFFKFNLRKNCFKFFSLWTRMPGYLKEIINYKSAYCEFCWPSTSSSSHTKNFSPWWFFFYFSLNNRWHLFPSRVHLMIIWKRVLKFFLSLLSSRSNLFVFFSFCSHIKIYCFNYHIFHIIGMEWKKWNSLHS